MKQLLIATTNPAKRREISEGLQDLVSQGLEILTLHDVPVKGEPIESGETFEENAKIKATFYGDQTGLPTISDDGGLMIDALGGKPGVKSRRWPGYEATDKELIQYALEQMKDIPPEKRTAQLETCVCLYIPPSVIPSKVEGSLQNTNTRFFCQQKGIHGVIAHKPCTWETNGYPYRALFIVTRYNKFYDELTDEEHHEINHRLEALRRLKTHIKEQIMV